MRSLVAIRRRTAFDPDFFRRDALFWPLERAAGAVAWAADFPSIDSLARVFDGEPAARFVPTRPRRRGEPLDVRALYDARIALDREVPTRDRCWHDLLNALVWGTFPRAKQALHARQHRALTAEIARHGGVLPPARTPELDALALLDEGGVILYGAAMGVLDRREGAPGFDLGPSDVVLFGHALYESLVLGVAPPVVAALALPVPAEVSLAPTPVLLRAVDEALAQTLENVALLQSPRELSRLRLPTGRPQVDGLRPSARVQRGQRQQSTGLP